MTNNEKAPESGSTVAKKKKPSRIGQWLLALLLLLVLIASIPLLWLSLIHI